MSENAKSFFYVSILATFSKIACGIAMRPHNKRRIKTLLENYSHGYTASNEDKVSPCPASLNE